MTFMEQEALVAPEQVAVPCSLDGERDLLGAILINPSVLPEVSEVVSADDFYVDRNRWIFEAIVRAGSSGSIDIRTVSQELQIPGLLKEAGGMAYLTQLMSNVPNSLHAVDYARPIRTLADKRRLIALANKIANWAYDNTVPVDTAILNAEYDLKEVALRSTSDDAGLVKELLPAVLDDIMKAKESPKLVWGIPTGLPRLDILTGGQHPSELTILAGEPAVGKTFLAIGMAIAMSRFAPGAFYSMEMKSKAIVMRMLSGLSSVPSRDMRTGFWAESTGAKIDAGAREIEDLPLYISDKGMNLAGLQRSVAGLKRRHGIKWFVLDYLMLVEEKAKDETEMTARVSAGVKKICMDLDVAAILLHSVNKEGMDKGEGGDVMKSYLRGSGQIIHDADNIFFVAPFSPRPNDQVGWIREEHKKRLNTLFVKKGREIDTPNAHIHLVRRDMSPLFGELDWEHKGPGDAPKPRDYNKFVNGDEDGTTHSTAV